ncbi:hypothetical protein AW089_26940 [Escherichia coli]|nr:hypothetical protein AW089_26940 [Escherichia coli]PSZ35463.1 hypothetical protein C7B05_25480 [Escherichia coli]
MAIDQIAQSGLSSLKVIYYSAQLFNGVYCSIAPQIPYTSSSVTAWTVTSEKRYLHRILNRLDILLIFMI